MNKPIRVRTKDGIEGYMSAGLLDVSIFPPLATVTITTDDEEEIYVGVEDLMSVQEIEDKKEEIKREKEDLIIFNWTIAGGIVGIWLSSGLGFLGVASVGISCLFLGHAIGVFIARGKI